MMHQMNPTTIDNLDIQSHRDYAATQARLDKLFLKEAKEISPHPEVTGVTSIYASEWAALFGLNLRFLPWAGFLPPPKFTTQSKRFFSYKILPTLPFPGEEKNKEEKKRQTKELIEKKANKSPDGAILSELVEMIFTLDDLLGRILAKKLQYHKG